jgi:two-component system NtrC family response regulator
VTRQKHEIATPGPDLPKLLIADDDDQIVRQLQWALSDEYTVLTACDRSSALQIARRETVPVALLDLGLPPHPREAVEGLRTLEELIANNPLIKVIIVSGNSERQNALQAVEGGAHDIFPKPVNLDELKIVLNRVYRLVEMERERAEVRNLGRQLSFESMIGSSDAMQSIYSMIDKVAKTDVPVLILGESGTGKELVANAIHNRSASKAGPFGVVNCGAIPEALLEAELFGYEKGAFTGATTQRRGKLEFARGGTFFLDEVADLAPELQVKLLRVLQEKVMERIGGRESIKVDCRIVAATNCDLENAVSENRFRQDLYFRLAVFKILVPALRDRGDDLIELAEYLLLSLSKELKRPPKRLSQSAIEAIRTYSWPGNVRELQNRIKRALVLTDGPTIGPAELEIQASQVGVAAAAKSTLREVKQGLEREIIYKKLQENGGNIAKTARELGISRPTLYERMKHGLQ